MASLQQSLRRLDILRPLPDRLIERLARASTLESVPRGQLLFRKGSPGTSIIGVLCGRVLAESESADGQELFHREVGPGQILGEIAVLDGGERTSSARALEPSELIVVEGSAFLDVVDRDGALGRRLATMIAQRIRSTSALLEDAVFLRARDRIAKKLLELSERTDEGCVVRRVAHQTLASMVGLKTRVSVTQQLALLEQRGLLDRSRRERWILPDPARLEALSSGAESA